MDKKHFLFVYGSLKKDEWNHHYLKDSLFVDLGRTNNKFSLVFGNLPFMIKKDGKGVDGEIYEITPKKIEELDTLEGHPTLYQRMKINITSSSQQTFKCLAYVYVGDLTSISTSNSKKKNFQTIHT